MADSVKPPTGTIGWLDLTVDDADRVRDFYARVAGWTAEPVEMEGYSDYVMVTPESGEPVAGVCHAKGPNAGLPASWMIYITVEDLDKSVAGCTELGGKVTVAPKSMGSHGRYCVIEDPAGAVCALFEPAG